MQGKFEHFATGPHGVGALSGSMRSVSSMRRACVLYSEDDQLVRGSLEGVRLGEGRAGKRHSAWHQHGVDALARAYIAQQLELVVGAHPEVESDRLRPIPVHDPRLDPGPAGLGDDQAPDVASEGISVVLGPALQPAEDSGRHAGLYQGISFVHCIEMDVIHIQGSVKWNPVQARRDVG